MATRQPALIFDFGNVIAFFDYRKACETLGRRLGLTGEAFLDRVRAAGFSPLVQRYESGQITAEAFCQGVSGLAGIELPFDEFSDAWSDIFWLNEPVAGLVPRLKAAGYTLVLGSNTNDLHAARFRGQFAETLDHFDRLVLSYEVGHIKPSRGFYDACVEAAGQPAGSCLFIDDLEENVQGARTAGLQGLVYRNPTTLRADLENLGISWPER